jgi:hypothetical protein
MFKLIVYLTLSVTIIGPYDGLEAPSPEKPFETWLAEAYTGAEDAEAYLVTCDTTCKCGCVVDKYGDINFLSRQDKFESLQTDVMIATPLCPKGVELRYTGGEYVKMKLGRVWLSAPLDGKLVQKLITELADPELIPVLAEAGASLGCSGGYCSAIQEYDLVAPRHGVVLCRGSDKGAVVVTAEAGYRFEFLE